MSSSSETGITPDDVRDFERKLKEEDRVRTAETARASLIRSGVLDKNGKPRWPISRHKRTSSAKSK